MKAASSLLLLGNRVLNWILYTSVFAAVCAVGLCMATERLVTGNVPETVTALHLFLFGSTLTVYNVHYLLKKSDVQVSDRFAWSQRNRHWQILVFGSGVLTGGIAAFYLPGRILLVSVLTAALAFPYSIPLLPFRNKKRLKDFGWIKILSLTTVWTIVTALLPVLYHQRPATGYPYELALRFLFLFTLCIAFDIRDMQTDLGAGIITLPNTIGIKNSYRLMDITLLLFAALGIVQYVRYPAIERITGGLVIAACTRWAVRYAGRHPSDRAYLGLVDGMMLLYAALLLFY